jgi:hypothetical protein
MIYDPTRHVAITSEPWSAELVLEAATNIFGDLCSRLEPNGLWPAHADEEGTLRFNKSLYNGATGTLWGLNELSPRLERPLPFDVSEFAERIYDIYLNEPDTGSVVPSFLLGEAGILLLCQKLNPSESTLKKLQQCTNANIRNPANEALWGCPGTMLAALRTGQKDIYRASASYLFEQWTESVDGLWLWHQDLYGKMRKLVGAGHGFFGNVHALLEGQEYLTSEQRHLLFDRTIGTALASARRENGKANWMPGFQMEDSRPPLSQWCHGAPGVITSLRSFPKKYSAELETLLIEAGETVWTSGPLKKGIGLCHGTDGNGFALLRLFERTGDELWLDRARRFAMHALTQRNGRSSLWTGEVGLALFLLACIDQQPDFPSLDYF